MQYSDEHLRYLRLLSQKYQTVAAAASEIIRIEALLRLPKGTEHFMSDLHGEHEAFVHILNSASGVIREKIDTVLGNGVPAEERAELATLVYYPNQKLPELKARQRDLHAWYRMTLLRLIDLCRFVSSKHTRDHVRRCLPQNCGYILDELLHAHFEDHDKDQYYGEIIESIIRYDRADAYIIRFCEVIKRLAVDRLHIVGDLFDRGPRPDRILDSLMAHHFETEVGPGVYDIHSPRIPSVEEIEAALRLMLDKIPADHLWVNPDCGLKTRGETETVASLKNMVQAAKNIRNECKGDI